MAPRPDDSALRRRPFLAPPGSVCISLGTIVLDRPDRTGMYIARDLAGGWAYLIADAEGDARSRGQGGCSGGLDTGLRCAFLSAIGRVRQTDRIILLVQDREAHLAMVRLAKSDPRVVAAIAGRQVAVMTRPQERSCFHVRTAAERAASAFLHDREQAEWRDPPAPMPLAGPTAPDAAPEPPRPDWRQRMAITDATPLVDRRAPIPEGAPRRRALAAWLSEFDGHVASVSADIRDVEGQVAGK